MLSYTATGLCLVTAMQAGDDAYEAAEPVSRVVSVIATQTIDFATIPSPAGAGTSVTLQATASSGLPVTFLASGSCTLSGSTLTFTTAGGLCIVTAFQPGDETTAAAPPVSQTISILANQTITFPALPSAPRVGTTTALKATASSGLPVTYLASGGCTVSGSTLTYSATTLCTVTANQAGDSAYAPAAPVSRSTTPVKGNQTITFPALATAPKVGTTVTLSPSASSGLPVSLSASGSCTLDGNVLTYTTAGQLCSVTATQAGDANWNAASPVTRTTTPAKNNQTITFPALPSSPVVGTSVTLTATASSGLTVTYAATGPCSVLGDLLTFDGVGKCTVTASQPGNDAYNAATSVSRSATSVKRPQTITVGALPASLPRNGSTTITATATSGLPVTFTATGKCTIAGNTITAAATTGTCTIKSNQAGDATWAAAPTVTSTISITP